MALTLELLWDILTARPTELLLEQFNLFPSDVLGTILDKRILESSFVILKYLSLTLPMLWLNFMHLSSCVPFLLTMNFFNFSSLSFFFLRKSSYCFLPKLFYFYLKSCILSWTSVLAIFWFSYCFLYYSNSSCILFLRWYVLSSFLMISPIYHNMIYTDFLRNAEVSSSPKLRNSLVRACCLWWTMLLLLTREFPSMRKIFD